MTYSNSCLIIVNNILREYIDNFPEYLSHGFEKLSEILPNVAPTLRNCSNIAWSNQGNKIEYNDNETNINLQILIQPTYNGLKEAIKNLTENEITRERYIVYVGTHGAGYSSDWLLEDGIFSANSMLKILSETEWNENNPPEIPPINILTPSNSAHWNKILSTLKIKETKQDRVRVFSFSPEISIDEDATINKDIENFSKMLYQKYQPVLINDDILNCSQSVGLLQIIDRKGSFYVFDESCGQSSLLALNGFNLLIDAGYKRAPQFWDFLQRLDKIDTQIITSWNATNLFGMESLLDFQARTTGNKDDITRPNLNYCILPIGPNPSKLKEFEPKSSLEVNMEIEAQKIVHQIKSLEIPLFQMSRDAKSMMTPHQLYFKLGHGCLDAFPLWPCSSETSGDSKRYVDEWQKDTKLQSIYFDELVKDNASAFLLIWNGSKVTMESQNDDTTIPTRILISSSCHESHLLKSLEEFSKLNPICNTLSGKPVEKKHLEKKSHHAKESPKSALGDIKSNALKKSPSTDKNKVDAPKISDKKPLPATDRATKAKADVKVPDKKDASTTGKISQEKCKSEHLQETKSSKVSSAKSVEPTENGKLAKKTAIKDKITEVAEIKKTTKKPLSNEKSSEIADLKKTTRKPLANEKGGEVTEVKKTTKKPLTNDKISDAVNDKKTTKKSLVNDKTNEVADLKKTTKKPLSSEVIDAKKTTKKPIEVESNDKKSIKKPTKSEMADPKKILKKPATDKSSEKQALNKKPNTEGKIEKVIKSLPNIETEKVLLNESSNDKENDVKILDNVTINKMDLESDLEKVDVVCQPSISLNTDDTLNNIDTSELLGKMEEIEQNSHHVEDDQLLITAERFDLQSTPLSDMITDSPEHPKTEEDVEALKTDALSIDQDLLMNNEEFPEDDKVNPLINDDFIAEDENIENDEIKNINASGDDHQEINEINDENFEYDLKENLNQYGVYEDGEYDDGHPVVDRETLSKVEVSLHDELIANEMENENLETVHVADQIEHFTDITESEALEVQESVDKEKSINLEEIANENMLPTNESEKTNSEENIDNYKHEGLSIEHDVSSTTDSLEIKENDSEMNQFINVKENDKEQDDNVEDQEIDFDKEEKFDNPENVSYDSLEKQENQPENTNVKQDLNEEYREEILSESDNSVEDYKLNVEEEVPDANIKSSIDHNLQDIIEQEYNSSNVENDFDDFSTGKLNETIHHTDVHQDNEDEHEELDVDLPHITEQPIDDYVHEVDDHLKDDLIKEDMKVDSQMKEFEVENYNVAADDFDNKSIVNFPEMTIEPSHQKLVEAEIHDNKSDDYLLPEIDDFTTLNNHQNEFEPNSCLLAFEKEDTGKYQDDEYQHHKDTEMTLLDIEDQVKHVEKVNDETYLRNFEEAVHSIDNKSDNDIHEECPDKHFELDKHSHASDLTNIINDENESESENDIQNQYPDKHTGYYDHSHKEEEEIKNITRDENESENEIHEKYSLKHTDHDNYSHSNQEELNNITKYENETQEQYPEVHADHDHHSHSNEEEITNIIKDDHVSESENEIQEQYSEKHSDHDDHFQANEEECANITKDENESENESQEQDPEVHSDHNDHSHANEEEITNIIKDDNASESENESQEQDPEKHSDHDDYSHTNQEEFAIITKDENESQEQYPEKHTDHDDHFQANEEEECANITKDENECDNDIEEPYHGKHCERDDHSNASEVEKSENIDEDENESCNIPRGHHEEQIKHHIVEDEYQNVIEDENLSDDDQKLGNIRDEHSLEHNEDAVSKEMSDENEENQEMIIHDDISNEYSDQESKDVIEEVENESDEEQLEINVKHDKYSDNDDDEKDKSVMHEDDSKIHEDNEINIKNDDYSEHVGCDEPIVLEEDDLLGYGHEEVPQDDEYHESNKHVKENEDTIVDNQEIKDHDDDFANETKKESHDLIKDAYELPNYQEDIFGIKDHSNFDTAENYESNTKSNDEEIIENLKEYENLSRMDKNDEIEDETKHDYHQEHQLEDDNEQNKYLDESHEEYKSNDNKKHDESGSEHIDKDSEDIFDPYSGDNCRKENFKSYPELHEEIDEALQNDNLEKIVSYDDNTSKNDDKTCLIFSNFKDEFDHSQLSHDNTPDNNGGFSTNNYPSEKVGIPVEYHREGSQPESTNSDNPHEIERCLPDSESNDSDLSVDVVRDHSEEISKQSEPDTFLPPIPVLDDILEDMSPSSPLVHEIPDARYNILTDESIQKNSKEQEPFDYHSHEESESDQPISNINITPDILQGIKHLNLPETAEVAVEQVVEDEEVIQFQTTHIDDSDNNKGSNAYDEETDMFGTNKDSLNFSDRDSSVESTASVVAQSQLANISEEPANNLSHKGDQDNLAGYVNGNNYGDHFAESNPASHWNEPLGLPMPTLINSKTTAKPQTTTKSPSTAKSLPITKPLSATKPSSAPKSSQPPKPSPPIKVSEKNTSPLASVKVKSTHSPPIKVNGSTSNTVSALANRTTDSPKSASSPRGSVNLRPSAPKSAPLTKTSVPKQTKTPEIIDHSKFPAFYMEIAYIPVDHDGNVNPIRVTEAFFTRIRARQYILPGLEHNSQVLDYLLASKKNWSEHENDMEVRLVPVKMTETLRKWAGQHAQELSQLNIKIGAAVENSSINIGGENSVPCIAHRIDF